MAELLPCPFCGAPAVLNEVPPPYSSSSVYCRDCRSSTEMYDADRQAIAAWNQRVPDKRQAAFDACVAALRWALPLAKLCLEKHRLLRLEYGHNIGTKRPGLTDTEVEAEEDADKALALAAEAEKP